MPNEDPDVRKAYEALLDAFANGREDDYFDAFHPDASFVFHEQPRLPSRAAYREAWDSWKRDMGFQVLGCTARDLMLQVFGDTAVASHSVETRQRMDGDESTAHERETIVFRKQDAGRWLAIHEHLSEDATPLEGQAD